MPSRTLAGHVFDCAWCCGLVTSQVVSGWNNGSVTVRHGETGEVVFKDSMGAGGVAGIVVSDYRLTGTPDVLVVSTGEGGGEQLGCL